MQALVMECSTTHISPLAWDYLNDLGCHPPDPSSAYSMLVTLQAQSEGEHAREQVQQQLKDNLDTVNTVKDKSRELWRLLQQLKIKRKLTCLRTATGQSLHSADAVAHEITSKLKSTMQATGASEDACRQYLHSFFLGRRAPRARSVHRSGNPALRKSRRRAPPARVPRGVKRRQSVTERPGSPRRKRPQLQQGDARSHTALEAPDRHGSPAGAPLPMSRHALSYLQLTGAITPERASRIVVVSTPEGQRTPLPTRSPEQPPHEKGRDIPPGIARMLQQIRMPQARPQPLQPRREPRPNARTSRTAVLPTGPPMGFNVTSTPSPRVLSKPGQFSPSPAWSPAVTSSWHSVRHVSPEHWSPACTPGGGSDRQQDSPHLPPVLLAPLFESAMSTPRRDSTQSASDEDVQQYAVRCSTPPDLPPTLLAPLFESVMSASRAGSTHRECDEDMGQYEVQYSTPPSVGEWPPNPFTFPSLRGAQRLCTELPGMARQGQGWVRDPHARHSTMLYSMQEGALSSNSAQGLMKHGRASREAT